MESKTLHRRKGTLQAFSRGSDIDELVLLVFWRMQAGDGYMFLILLELGLQLGSDRIWICSWVQIAFGQWFSLSRTSVLSHGWIPVVSQAFLYAFRI